MGKDRESAFEKLRDQVIERCLPEKDIERDGDTVGSVDVHDGEYLHEFLKERVCKGTPGSNIDEYSDFADLMGVKVTYLSTLRRRGLRRKALNALFPALIQYRYPSGTLEDVLTEYVQYCDDTFEKEPVAFSHPDSQDALDFARSVGPKGQAPVDASEDVSTASTTFFLGGRDTNICVIDGNGEHGIELNNIICNFTQEKLNVPAELAPRVEEIIQEAEAKKAQSLPHPFNGDMVHIRRFTVSRKENTESSELVLYLQRAQYFHYMAANVPADAGFRREGLEAKERLDTIKDFAEWREKAIPNVVNGLPVNLLIRTSDGSLVFSRRSKSLAIAPGVVSFAVNENMHPEHDRAGGSRLSVKLLVSRALSEEIGWPIDREADVSILGFSVDVGGLTYGLFGYVEIPATFEELLDHYTVAARDRHEASALIKTGSSLNQVATFIHSNDLYNLIGVGAFYYLRHCRGFSVAEIQSTFRRLQNPS